MYLEPPLVVPTADTRCLGAVVVSVRGEADLSRDVFDDELVKHDLPRLDTRGRLRWRMAITPRGWRTVEFLLLRFPGRPADLSDGLELAGSANWSHGETALDLRRRADGQTARRGSGDRGAEPVIAGRPSRCRAPTATGRVTRARRVACASLSRHNIAHGLPGTVVYPIRRPS